MTLDVGLSYIAVIMFRYASSVPGVSMKGWGTFVKGFLCVYLDNDVISVFEFIYVMNYISWIIPTFLNETNLVMMNNLFDMILS